MSEIVVTVKLPKGVEADGVEVTVDPMPAQTEESSQQPPLDRAWGAVNVLGAPDTACRTAEDLAYCRGIGDALAQIEKLGGRAS